MGFDGRKDLHTRKMVACSSETLKMRLVKQEHVSVGVESSGGYLADLVPEKSINRDKLALKIAQAL